MTPTGRGSPRLWSHSTPGVIAVLITNATKRANSTIRNRNNSQKATPTKTTKMVARATFEALQLGKSGEVSEAILFVFHLNQYSDKQNCPHTPPQKNYL
jgi:hypothetical protein